MLCYAMLCYAMLCYTILYYTILYYTILYYTILYDATLTILYYTILYCAAHVYCNPKQPNAVAQTTNLVSCCKLCGRMFTVISSTKTPWFKT